jgi:hypothetical protein
MDLGHEELAWRRAHEPGLRPPTRHLPPSERRGRRRVASTLRRVADRLEG